MECKVDEFRARSGRTPKKSRDDDWLQTEGILLLGSCFHIKRTKGSNWVFVVDRHHFLVGFYVLKQTVMSSLTSQRLLDPIPYYILKA
jgi:hypothetical protein